MGDYTTHTIDTVARSIDGVITRSVDADDPFATDQIRMVSEHLRFLRERGGLAELRARHELRIYIDMARGVDALASIDGGAALIRRATEVMKDPFAGLPTLDRTAGMLREALSAAARNGLDRAAERVIMDRSADLVALQRWFFGPMGWDPDIAEVDSPFARGTTGGR